MDLLSISQRLLEAVAWHRAGRLQEAEQAYREVLRGDPAHLDANRLLGILTTQTDGSTFTVHYNLCSFA